MLILFCLVIWLVVRCFCCGYYYCCYACCFGCHNVICNEWRRHTSNAKIGHIYYTSQTILSLAHIIYYPFFFCATTGDKLSYGCGVCHFGMLTERHATISNDAHALTDTMNIHAPMRREDFFGGCQQRLLSSSEPVPCCCVGDLVAMRWFCAAEKILYTRIVHDLMRPLEHRASFAFLGRQRYADAKQWVFIFSGTL